MDAKTFAAAALIPLARAEEWVMPLTAAMLSNEIDTPPRQAAFIAQTAHESMHYTAIAEDLYYRSAERIAKIWPSRFASADVAAYYVHRPEELANFVYANRLGNGDVETGDGWAYRGRGLIMGTGRDWYLRMSDELGFDLVGNPEMVEEPEMACMTSARWWLLRDLNELADRGAIDRITRRVTGPSMLGRLERSVGFDKALRVLLRAAEAR